MEPKAEPKLKRKDPDAHCENCPWYEKGGFAGASGPEDAPILVVGEAPGRVEVDSGEPFTGPSGKLLDMVLSHHGVDRKGIRFTNVAACHPPFGTGSATTPPKEVIACCRPRLRRELDGRTQILTLGNTAKQAVLGTTEAISKVRIGPPRTVDGLSREGLKTEVVATLHPAACLRHGDSFPSLVKDIGKLAHPELFIKWEPPVHKDFDTEREALAIITQLHQYPELTIDIETDVDKGQYFTMPKLILSIGISYAPNKAVVLGEQCLKSLTVRRKLGELLRVKRITCHNGKYDLQVLMRFGIIVEPGLYFDTMLANYVLDERPGQHGLEGVASELLGTPSWKAEIDPYTKGGQSYANIPRDLLYKYNAWDAAQTFNLKDHFVQTLEAKGMRHVHDMLVDFSNELTYVELGGVHIDEPYRLQLADEYQKEIAQLDLDLKQWVDNPRSWQQVGAAIKAMGLFAPDTTADTLERLLTQTGGEQQEFFRLMLKSRKAGKMYGTYVKGIGQRMVDGYVYPSYLIHGTVFGRLAARDPNIHNVPRGDKLRRMYTPDEGHVFVQCDYGAAELRVIACEAKDEYLRGVFNDEKRNIHDEVSDTLYGIDNWGKEERVRTKAFVFGSAYGREAFSIAQEYDLQQHVADQLQNGFFGMIPDTMKWRKEIQHKVFDRGETLQTHFGRKRRFHLITRENKRDVGKEALAFVPQSTASDICLHALSRIRRHFGWSERSPKVRITVHDSVLAECSPEESAEVGKDMSRIMEETAREVYSDYVPFIADAERGQSWGELTEE